MKTKITFQKIGKFFLTLFGLFAVNLVVSVVAFIFVMFIWAITGDDNQQEMMRKVAYYAAIAMFVLMSFVEIVWYSLKART